MKRLLLLLAAFLPFSSLTADTVTVDPLQRYQTFRGFGTCLIFWIGEMESLYQTTEFQQDYAEELNLSLLRVDLLPSVLETEIADADAITQNSLQMNSQANIYLDFAKATTEIQPEMRTILSVWSVPPWMKTNGSIIDGGAIKPSHYEHAAAFIIAYIRKYQSEGVEVLGVSFANEPLFAQDYKSQVMEPEPYADMLAVLGARLEAEGLEDILIYGPEHMTHDSPRNAQYANAINSHETAWKYLDALASHGYTDGINTDPSRTAPVRIWNNVAKPNGWEFWMSEAGSSTDDIVDFSGAVGQLGGMIQNHLVDANCSLFTLWQISDMQASVHNLMVRGQHTDKSRVMQQYATTILPGMRRLHTNIEGDARTMVFVDEDEGKMGIVVLNPKNGDETVDFNIPTMPEATFKVHRLTESAYYEELSDIGTTDGSFTVEAPGWSIVSLLATDVDFSTFQSEDELTLGDGTDPIVVPGYASQISIPVTAPDGYSWSAALSHFQWARIADGNDSGTGSGSIVINIPDNYSDTDSRQVQLEMNGRELIIEQEPYSDPPAGESWWKSVTPEGGARNTSLLTDSEPGIGWIYDENWPFIYSYTMDTWLYVLTDGDPSGFYAYRFDTAGWIWASNAWGWYYDFDTGWGRFNL